MFVCEAKVLIARETGWTLEYIGQLSQPTAFALVRLIMHQRASEQYQLASYFGMCIATWANGQGKRHFRVENFVGQPPKEITGVIALNKQKQPLCLVLGDGNEYEFASLDMNTMEEVENHYDKPWLELFSGKGIRVGIIKYTLWCVLKRTYPDMTVETAGALLTAEVFNANYVKIVKHISS